MAAPMMRWALETYYEPGAERARFTMALPNAREADLTDLMETFVADYSDLTFSSLPQHTNAGPRVILSISGLPEKAEKAYGDLKRRLTEVAVMFEENAS